MDSQLLKTFLEVAKIRHFGRAAENLFITQSAVSARIKLLEEKLGVDLFIRQRNNIQLTPAGSRLHQHAESIVRGWERARQAIAIDPDQSISLVTGCVFDLWKIFVDRWIMDLHQLDQAMAIQIDIETADILVQRLTLGVIDLAFMFDPPQTPDLELKQVRAVPLHLVSTVKKQTAEDAMNGNYIMVDWGSAFGVVHADQFPELPPPMLRTNSGQIALDMLREQGGAAYLPEPLVAEKLTKRQLHLVTDAPVIDRLAYAVYRPENLTKRSLKTAMAALRSV